MEEDLLHLILENQNQDGRIKKGGWAKVTAQYNLKHKTSHNQRTIRNYYLLHLKETDKPSNQKSNAEIANGKIKSDEKQISQDDSQNNKKMAINEELKSYYVELENTFLGLNIEETETWTQTQKISSLVINYSTLSQIDSSVKILINQHKITDICDIVKTLYASQLIYMEKTKRPAPKTNWINNINEKIKKRSEDARIVGKLIRGENLDPEEQKAFRYISAKRRTKKQEWDCRISNP